MAGGWDTWLQVLSYLILNYESCQVMGAYYLTFLNEVSVWEEEWTTSTMADNIKVLNSCFALNRF